MLDVIFYEAFTEEEISLKKYINSSLKVSYRQNPLQDYKDVEPPRLISIRTHSRIPSAWKEKIKGVFTRSSGFDHLYEFLEFSGGKIPCGYLSNYCARSVAEHAITVLLSLFKKLNKQREHFSTFDRNGLTCKDCHHRNLLVVGVGKIGSKIAKLGKALQMNVKGIDLVEREVDLEYSSLKNGVSWADAIICALPLTQLTKNMLNFSTLKEIKKGGVFINISRGEISPLQDLAELLDQGIIDGLGLDVFEEEDVLRDALQKDYKDAKQYWKLALSLKNRPEVIFTPHNAFNTEESLDNKSRLTAASIKHFFEHGHFLDEVQ